LNPPQARAGGRQNLLPVAQLRVGLL